MINHRVTRIAAAAVAIAAAAAPAASAMPVDGPITSAQLPRDPTRSTESPQDLRSPDTRDAAEGRHISQAPPQDLRHPDTRDYAEGRGTYNSPEVVVVERPATVAQPTEGGIDWQDVGIGAGGLLGVALVGAGGALVAAHRRTARQIAG
jgi:hypothetical protein